jgi:hypothetical protein
MSKKLILALVGVVFLSSFNLARAEVIINEFVSDPDSGLEWIELLNTSSTEINLDGWKWTELASPGQDNEHESSPKSLNGVIGGGGFFVFEMSSALNNSGDSIGLYNGANLEQRVTFGTVNNYSKDLETPAKGKSGALISGTWKTSQEPTRGQTNSSSGSSGQEESDTEISSDDNGNSSSSVTAKTPPKLQKPKVQIISKKIAHVGVPLLLEGTGTGTLGEKLSHGRYYWNFGDGDFRETKVTNTEKFTHTYFYPGEYTILFEHYPDSFTDVPDATAEIAIEVIEPKILISKVGNANDFFIEMTNETGHDADISNWVLLSNYRVFTFPKNTNMSSNRKMIISPRISGFNIEDKSTLKLMTAEREVVFDYSSPASRQGLAVKNKSAPRPNLPESSVVSALENLPALALGNNISKQEIGDSKSSLITPLISFVFIGASAYAVYFIRRRKVVTEKGEDFEILDE